MVGRRLVRNGLAPKRGCIGRCKSILVALTARSDSLINTVAFNIISK
jgi:hypothetical protein